ncbi:hypothetical protein BDW69DRAFT_163771 [Aspergillus filifer]
MLCNVGAMPADSPLQATALSFLVSAFVVLSFLHLDSVSKIRVISKNLNLEGSL